MNINSVNTYSGNLDWIDMKCLCSFPEYFLYEDNSTWLCFADADDKPPSKEDQRLLKDVSHLVITPKMESQLFKLNTRFEVHNVVCSCF